MHLKSLWTLCLALLAGLAGLAPAARGATAVPCKPVVYVFRNAEDISTPGNPCLPGHNIQCFNTLTLAGKARADQYLEMITALGDQNNLCPVRAVYAVHPIKPSGSSGPTSPFQSGEPLARAVMDKYPHVQVDGIRIDENLMFVTPDQLRSELVDQAKAQMSSALFWTTTLPLHRLVQALFDSPIIPKTELAPRNAAYIFRYRDDGTFAPPVKNDEFLQCFNFTDNGSRKNDFTNKFYCATPTNADLTGLLQNDFVNLHSRICNTLAADFTKTPDLPGYIGFCKSPKSP